MELSRRSRLPPLIAFLVILCIHTSQARFYGDRQKRQNGAKMYLPASSIVPGGEGSDPNEWSEWSSPSECSRSCGGGVSYQTRECLRKGPDGSPMCEGGNRQYFSCNTQDCPEEEPDFRAQQCSRFNHVPFDGVSYEWVPYTNAPNPCELNCMPKGERFYYRHKAKVIDGTRCNDQDLNVCVDGQCQPVGCDMMLGSGAKEDSCRKCGGDGSTCRRVADRFTTSNLAAGYNDLLLIPSGSTNIRIQETVPSNNYMACRNLSSHYYLNGNWRIDFPRPMFFAGSWWTYQRKPTGFAAPDQLTCRGPITESIYIVMLVQDKNVSIDYEYSVPQTVNANTPAVYTWTHMEYGPCSASCGGGTQTRTVTCNNRLNLEEVDDQFCDEKAKPAESQECGTEPCAPHWESTDWGKCSKGCGSDGIRNRTVSCERTSPTGERTVEDDSVCLQEVGNKPADQQECNRDVKNCPKYHLGPWSPCDKLCGEGKRSRKVTCYIEENGRKKVLDDDDCVEEKPETETTCMLAPCEGVDWILSQWSGCDACGQTTETRTAICGSKSGKVYDDEFCAPEVPLLSRPCKANKCKTQWFTSEWSKCSSPCGKGAQSRVVLCGEFDGKKVIKVTDESKCDATTKPAESQECEGEEVECPGQWFTGPWQSCSKPCGGGERQREVMCLSNGTKSTNCDETKIESLSEKCNTQACTEDEIMPVDSTDNPISDDDEEDCEEEDEGDEMKLVTPKMSEDLKISDGIELDEDTTISTLMTDELMMSDSTPPTDTTYESESTESPLTTVEGSGDETESTDDMSTIGTEGSGDEETSTGVYESTVYSSTDAGTTDKSSSESSTVFSTETSTDSATDSTTESSGSTDVTTESSSSTDVSSSTGSLSTTEGSVSTIDSSAPTAASSSTDASASTDTSDSTEASTSTDVSGSTDSSASTDVSGSTESSASTEVSSSTDSSASTSATGSTDSSASTDVSGSTDYSTSGSTDLSASTDVSGSTDSTASTSAAGSTDSSASTDVSGSTADSSASTSATGSTDSSASTDVSSSTDSSASTSATGSTDSSASTDISGTTEASPSGSTDPSTSTGVTGTSDSSLSTDASKTTDASSSTDVSDTTNTSTSTDVSDTTASTEPSVSTDTTDTTLSISTDTTDASDSTTVSTSTDASTATDISSSTEASASTDVSGSTDASATTVVSGSTDASASTVVSGSTDASASTDVSGSTDASTSKTSGSTSTSTGTDISSSTEASASTDVSGSTDASASTDVSGSTAASASTDVSGSTADSVSTDVSGSTGIPASTESSVSSGVTGSTDVSASTDVTGSTDASDTTEVSGSTAASATTDASMSTDVSASTDAAGSTGLSDITTEAGSTDSSTESSGTTDSSVSTHTTTSPVDDSSATSSDVSTGSTIISASTDSESTIVTESGTTESGEGVTTTSDETTDLPGSGDTDITTEGVSDDTTLESGATDDATESTGSGSSSSEGPSTSSDLFDSTTESSGDTSLSTGEFTTVDIWATEDDDMEKSTPNTLESVITKESKPRKCKSKKPKHCSKTEHGCCPDGKTIAKGPFDEGCSIPKTCGETKFGCCPDGVSPADGDNKKGCPKSQCAETLFGCCPDNYTPSEGEDNEGCPEPTTEPPTTTTEMPEEETTFETESSTDSTETPESTETTETGEYTDSSESTDITETTEAPVEQETVQSCSFGEFGCCPDGTTSATGINFAGCNVDCRNTEFGCCRDGRTLASGPDYQGCPACTFEAYGCCPDKETPAHGPLGEGCCLNSPYGCCPDNINSARGPNFEDCDCQYGPYGCCPDNKTAARGPSNEGCGCEVSQFGCCPDKRTPAQGPKFEGCACHTLQFGCCPDGVSIAQGPHHYGCHCSQTEHKCCPDDKTAAKGPNFEGCTCLESKYGCCPDGVASAQGDKFEGCENVKEPPQKSCGLPKETGPCGNFSIKYFFDTSYGACAKFWYGGCDGNGNRFETESDCKETCQDYTGKEACFLPKSSGPCTGYITKWYFDADRGRCEEFKYGGCFGTNNRFDSKEECQSLCSVSETTPPCDQPMDEGPCEGNFERWFYDNQTDVCRPFRYGGCKGNKNNYATENACNYHCRQPGVHKDYCSLPKQTGDCGEKHPRWHYSEAEKKCMPFYYTGCGGNKNSFPSLESCEDHCPKEVAKDICEIPAEVGDCTNYQAMWYYDTKDQRCRQFYYGGCGGNENKFASEESCLQRCEKKPEPEPQPQPPAQPEQPLSSTNVCDEKPEQGPCSNYTLFWHYDNEQAVCRQFYYGGCEGNGNRFNSQEECAHQCIREAPREPVPNVQQPAPAPAPAPEQTAPGQEENICLLAQDMGDCDEYVAMWYFDSQESRCAMFYYGGCGGNDNRFASEVECNNRCLSENIPDEFEVRLGEPEPETDNSRKCFLPAAPGNCLDNNVRWYYNSNDGVCDQFVYTGCEGNANNYATEVECEDECLEVQNTCQLPVLPGNCNETMIRWHYSEAEGRCNEFEFTGCRGNRNNFVTERECMLRCGSGEPPAPTYSVCDLPMEAGECENSTTAWHYDNENMQCVAFTYTGCGGNGNRFQSREQCERQCGEYKGVDVCNEDVKSGPCRQWQVRYYFNKRTRTCDPFTYGGCQGTGNRFENRAECESLCIVGQEPTYSDTKDICKQQVDVGRCNGPSVNEGRWYYDDARGNCVSFIYSGCAGNQNNFRTYESCYDYCSKPEITNNEVLPTNRCEEYENECKSLSCPYGMRRIAVDEECSRCECDNPCADYTCPEGQQCAVEVSNERSGEFRPECRLINKPGTCPQLSTSDGACGRECYTDADCRENNKCCSNGCGFVCVHPEVPTRPTTAPTTPAPVVVYPGEVKVSLEPKEKPEVDVQTPMGGIAVLRCFATGNPAPNVTWSRSNVVVDTNQGRYVLTSSGDLTIVQVRQTDSGSYVCIASNGLGEPVRREIELQVTDPVPMPAYVFGDKNVTQIVTLNRPAVVRCPAGGHPTPMVHWWRNRSRLPLVSNRFELARDYSLTFRSVQLSDLGPYTCEAWNRLSVRPSSIKVTLVAVGPARATTNEEAQYLQYIVEPPKAPVTQRPQYPFRPTRPPAVPPPYVVQAPREPAVPVSAVIGMDPSNSYQPGSTVAFGCSVQGYPTPNVTWIKDGLPLVPSERVQISVRAPHRVIINNVGTADSGTYGCKAANAVSYSSSEEMINIESTIPLNPECIDNGHFANCNLIVRGRYCKNKYYAKFCCRSCALAGQL